MKIKQYKTARRLGARIFSKTQSPKFVLARSRAIGKKRPSALSEYGLQLLEKQKARYSYNLNERQFSKYAKMAISKKGVNPAEFLYKNLESRLDNIVYRLGLAKTRPYARQMVSHGHIMVNGRRVTIPSMSLRSGDAVSIRPGSKNKRMFESMAERLKDHAAPSWLTLDRDKIHGVVSGAPSLQEMSDGIFSLASVVEFYSR